MNEVKAFAPIDRGVNQEAIDATENLLANLRNGNTRAVAFVAVNRGGGVSTCYVNSSEGSYHGLNSGCARLAARIANEPDDTVPANPKDWVGS